MLRLLTQADGGFSYTCFVASYAGIDANCIVRDYNSFLLPQHAEKAEGKPNLFLKKAVIENLFYKANYGIGQDLRDADEI